jgi:hypothetical protein
MRLRYFLAIACDACMIRTSSDTTMTKNIKLSISGKRNKNVMIAIDAKLHDEIEQIAKEADVTFSTCTYQILKQAIDHVEV